MKIKSIRGKNLASIGPEFELLLDDGALKQVGLIAISGPTGAGKSTLLDALCLALFDRVPRFEGASYEASDEFKGSDPRQILRNRAVEAYAEVEFIGQDDRVYTSRWSVRRARLRADGRIQPQEMSLIQASTEQRIGRTKKEVLHEIEERLGLSYPQFRRSVLLAQGDFAAFLKASERDRSELLERITGTEIYSQVSILAYARAAEQRFIVEQLHQRLQAIPQPSPKDQTQSAQLLERSLQELQNNEKACQVALSWYDEKSRATAALTAATSSLKRATEVWEATRQDREKLDLLELLRPLRPSFDRQTKLEAEIKNTRQSIDSLKQEQSANEIALKECREEVQKGDLAIARLYALRDVAVEIEAITKEESAAELQQQKREKRADEIESLLEQTSRKINRTVLDLDNAENQLAQFRSRQELDQLRHQLQQGEPCPLCGSTEHPWESNTAHETESKLKASTSTLKAQHLDLIKQRSTLEAEQQQITKDYEESKRLTEQRVQLKASIKKKWTSENPKESPSESEWSEQLALALSINSKGQLSATNSSPQTSQGSTIVKQLDTTRNALRRLENEQARMESTLSLQLDSLSNLESELDEVKTAFHQKLRSLQLTASDAASLLQEKLEWESAKRSKIEKLRAERIHLEGQREACQERLRKHEDIGRPEQSEAEMRQSHKRLSQEISRKTQQLIEARALAALEQKQEKERQQLEQSYRSQLELSNTSEALSELIGSRDGHKFRRFAQSLSLYALISASNAHLEQLSPRYRLAKQSRQDLGITIIDQEMGDEQRSPDSLSGGESFLVSLALALGLASLSSDQTQIESLFIDEGFGTLDQASLDQVLDALDQLQALGRQIAVISHLPPLIERVSHRVDVKPTAEGSTLSISF